MMEALSSSETSVLTRTTRRKIPEDIIGFVAEKYSMKAFMGHGVEAPALLISPLLKEALSARCLLFVAFISLNILITVLFYNLITAEPIVKRFSLNVHCRFHNIPSLVPVLNQATSFTLFPQYAIKYYFPSMPISIKWPFRFPSEALHIYPIPLAPVNSSSQFNLLDFITLILFKKYISKKSPQDVFFAFL
jgi:hypothetical protein